MNSANGVFNISEEYLEVIQYLRQGKYAKVLELLSDFKNDRNYETNLNLIKAFALTKINKVETARENLACSRWMDEPVELSAFLQSEIDAILQPIQEEKPKIINFQINDICNSRCIMCNIWKQKSRDEITLEEFDQLISHPFFSEVISVGITGGEPTLRKDLASFYISLADKLPNLQSSTFITNGFLVEKATRDYSEIDAYYKEKKLGFAGMVSLDGVGKVHDQVRGIPGAFEKSRSTLFNLMHNGVSVHACCTIVKENVYALHELLAWGRKNGVYIRFRVGEFINRLYNADRKDQIRNFDLHERQHLVSFLYYLIQSYETDPQVINTYYSIISILTGGQRLIQCPYQTNHSINIGSRSQFSYCAPKGDEYLLGPDPEFSFREKRNERFLIQMLHCPDCIHDYHSTNTPQRNLALKLTDQVKKRLYSVPQEELDNITEYSNEISWSNINIVMMVGWYGTETAGDIAILAGIMQEYLKRNPALKIVLLSLYPYYTNQSLKSLPDDLLSHLKVVDFWGIEALNSTAICDAVVMAGGPLMDIPYTYEISCLFYEFFRQNKPCIVEGCGIGPLNNIQYKQNVINIIRMSSYVSVRDSNSKTDLTQYGISKQIIVRPDPSITYINSCHFDPASKEKVIRFYLRELTSEYPQKVSPIEAENRIVALIKDIIAWFPEFKLELWAMHYFPVGNDDRQFNAHLAARINDPAIKVIVEPKSPEEILASMNSASFCICMRFHSVVFASTLKTQFIAIDYTNGGKISGYLKDNRQESRRTTLENLSKINRENLLAMLKNIPVHETVKQNKVAQISTYDCGGAGNATFRLNTALNLLGNYSSTIIVKTKSSDNLSVHENDASDEDQLSDHLYTTILHNFGIDQNRTDLSNTLFSLPVFGYNLINNPLVQQADILNLHWVSFFQSPETLKFLASLGKPVTWTIHDEWVYTGGCHYSSGCDRYKYDCTQCPQLVEDINDIPSIFLQLKKEMLETLSPVIISPSRWLANKVKENPLTKGLRVEVIPNSIDIDLFSPMEKKAARVQLELNPKGFYLLFGVESGNEKRKGFSELSKALRLCQNDPKFNAMVQKGELVLLSFGEINDSISEIDLPIKNFGYVKDEKKLAIIYNAASYYVLPSLEDNLPNTILESFGCGTPVIAFNTGGIPEMVEHGVTGLLAQTEGVNSLSQVILEALNLSEDVALTMRRNVRDKVMRDYSMVVQARHYGDLYTELINSHKPINIKSKEIVQPNFVDLVFRKYPKLNDFYIETQTRFIRKREKDFIESEADRAARLEQIQQYSKWLKESEKIINDQRITILIFKKFKSGIKNIAKRLGVLKEK